MHTVRLWEQRQEHTIKTEIGAAVWAAIFQNGETTFHVAGTEQNPLGWRVTVEQVSFGLPEPSETS